MKHYKIIPLAILSLPSLLFSITDASWAVPSPGNGDWNNDANWSYNVPPNAFPNGIDTTARFDAPASLFSVIIGQNITAGHILSSNNVVQSTAISSDSSFTFAVSSGNATADVTNSRYQLFAIPVILSSPLVINAGANFNLSFYIRGALTGSQTVTVENGFFAYEMSGGELVSDFTGNLNLDSTGTAQLQNSTSYPTVFGGITGTGTLLLGGNAKPTFVSINSQAPSTFSGNITKTGAFNSYLIKQGSATFTMDCTGGAFDILALQAGTISAGSLDNLANPGAFTFFDPSFSIGSSATLHISGGASINYPGSFSIGQAAIAQVDIDSDSVLTLSGSLSGTVGSFQKLGGGVWVLSGTPSTFTAPIAVLEGALTVSASIENPVTVSSGVYNLSGSTTGETTVNSGGIFNVTGTASGNTIVNSGGTFNVINTVSGETTVNSGGIFSVSGTGSGTTTVNSGGVFSVTNTVSGTTTVSGGVFILSGTASGPTVVNTGGYLTSQDLLQI